MAKALPSALAHRSDHSVWVKWRKKAPWLTTRMTRSGRLRSMRLTSRARASKLASSGA